MRSALLESQSVKILQAESKLICVIFDIKKFLRGKATIKKLRKCSLVEMRNGNDKTKQFFWNNRHTHNEKLKHRNRLRTVRWKHKTTGALQLVLLAHET